MTWLDVAAAALVVASGLAGWRLGFLQRALNWTGLAVGLVGSSLLLPVLMSPDDGPSVSMFLLGVGVLSCGAVLGLVAGGLVGGLVRPADPPRVAVGLDRATGTVVGVLGAVLALWVVVPSMGQVPGWPARAVDDAWIADALDERLGEPPFALDGLSEALGLPELATFLDGWNVPVDTIDVSPPPDSGLGDDELAAARAATMKIIGPACGLIQSGSGALVDADLVVTNAHVVAGTSRLTVVDAEGEERRAELVAIDGDLDLALVRVPGLGAAPLPVGATRVGASGAVLGYPLGGGFDARPYEVVRRIDTVGPNIYGTSDVERAVLVVAADLTQGNSGGPLVDAEGRLVGLAFAVAQDGSSVAYAVDGDEVATFLEREAAPGTTSSGACLS